MRKSWPVESPQKAGIPSFLHRPQGSQGTAHSGLEFEFRCTMQNFRRVAAAAPAALCSLRPALWHSIVGPMHQTWPTTWTPSLAKFEVSDGPQAPVKPREKPSAFGQQALLVHLQVCQKVPRYGRGWSIENPSSSLMWITQPFVDLMRSIGKRAPWPAVSHLHVWRPTQKADSAVDQCR